MELLDNGSPAFVSWDGLHFHDLDGVGTGAVPSSQVAVALGHSCLSSQIPVLLVHVVGATARVITQPHAIVLDGQRALLIDLQRSERQKRIDTTMNYVTMSNLLCMTVGLRV